MKKTAAAGLVAMAILVGSAGACLREKRVLQEQEADGSVEASADGGCIDPSGFEGRGCFRCVPTTNDELLRACTTSRFESFDNAKRIAGFDPNNPTPALVAGGPTPPPFDAGAPPQDAGTDAGIPPVNPPCPIDTSPNPVMVLGATGFPLETIAKAMGNEATIFYAEKGSCDGVASMILNTPKLTGTIVYYDSSSGAPIKCSLAEDHPADMTFTALFPETCASQSNLPSNVQLPPGVIDFLGSVSVIMFAAPATSPERSISAEAAWKVYGFGNASGVEPWTNEEFIFRRTPSSGNQQAIALSLGLPVTELRGRDSSGSSNMLRALQASPEPARTIGISSSEIVDPNRDVMKALAYQHYKQPVGFYPDSDPGSFDRRNVRDGHYFLWAPLHVLVRTNAGDPIAAPNTRLDPAGTNKASRDASVKLLTLVMASRQEAPVRSVDLFGALKKIGNVPQCAMRVTRPKDGAPLEPFKPSASCGCAFEAASPGTTGSECIRCTEPSVCPSTHPRCTFGFCE